MRPRSVVITVLLVLSLALAAQNMEVIEIALFFWSVTISPAILILGTLGVGFFLGLLVGCPWRPRQAKPSKRPKDREEEDA
jgi:uncharacterized integral membrane protein